MLTVDRGFDLVEAKIGELLRAPKGVDQRVRLGGEVLDRDAHGADGDLEIAAGIGKPPRLLDGLECIADVAFARDIGESDRKESCHRDQRQRYDAGAYRARCQQPVKPVERERHREWKRQLFKAETHGIGRSRGGKNCAEAMPRSKREMVNFIAT